MSEQLIGKGSNSSVWHIVRAPYSNEGVDIDRETHVMSLCSLIWTIVKTRPGTATCKLCIKQSQLINGEIPDRACSTGRERWAQHRQRQRAAVLHLP